MNHDIKTVQRLENNLPPGCHVLANDNIINSLKRKKLKLQEKKIDSHSLRDKILLKKQLLKFKGNKKYKNGLDSNKIDVIQLNNMEHKLNNKRKLLSSKVNKEHLKEISKNKKILTNKPKFLKHKIKDICTQGKNCTKEINRLNRELEHLNRRLDGNDKNDNKSYKHSYLQNRIKIAKIMNSKESQREKNLKKKLNNINLEIIKKSF